MVHQTSRNRELTGVVFPLGTVKKARKLKINISGICQIAIAEEIKRRELEKE